MKTNIDNQKVSDVYTFVSFIIERGNKIDNEILAEAQVDNYILEAQNHFGKLNTLEFKKIKDLINEQFEFKLNRGTYIEETEHQSWFYDRKKIIENVFWERYKSYLIKEAGFNASMVNTLDQEVLDELVDLLGDPECLYDFSRKGLVIGDVQSGKTSTYTGLICKAADAGYKVIILLTGTIESLRVQTQKRLDAGFTGIDSAHLINKQLNEMAFIGVGKYRKKSVLSLTSTLDDFVIDSAKNLNFTLDSFSVPVLFVIKKNVKVLDRLYKWLINLNADSGGKINFPMLMIDDEADNASINTKYEDESPTKTNACIRKLIQLFPKSNYLGFTATPYANVFIDPETEDEMLGSDIFPKDFIYALEAPSNYIGANQIFFESGKFYNSLKYIDDAESSIPQNHKKELEIYSIPDSLENAIYAFILSNTIRDLRGDIFSHRSMLINVTRYISVQKKLAKYIEGIYNRIFNDLQTFSKLDFEDSMKNPTMKEIYNFWSREFSFLEFKWEQIQKNIYESNYSIRIMVVNSSKDSQVLNYDNYKKTGLRVIAIGGLSLSRGLTLEGLVTSYFYRNSKTYDVLMQMGRWFGYRRGYDDLFRIWMSEETAKWYEEIADATNELKLELKRMKKLNQTPKEFGIRVRNDITTLKITANNKMRSTGEQIQLVSLYGEVVETPHIYKSLDINIFNLQKVEYLINKAIESGSEFKLSDWNHPICPNVRKTEVLQFLSEIKVSFLNTSFDQNGLYAFINEHPGSELDLWDVAFMEGNAKNGNKFVLLGKEITMVSRIFGINEDTISMSDKSSKLGGPADTQEGLTKQIAEQAYREYLEDHPDLNKNRKSYNNKIFLKYVKDRKPLLIIYLVSLYSEDNNTEKKEIKNQFLEASVPLVGFAIGIPKIDSSESKAHRYKINKVKLRELNRLNLSEEEGDE